MGGGEAFPRRVTVGTWDGMHAYLLNEPHARFDEAFPPLSNSMQHVGRVGWCM